MKASKLSGIKSRVARRTAFLDQEPDLEKRRDLAFGLVEEQQAKVEVLRTKLELARTELREYDDVFQAIANKHEAAGGFDHYCENKTTAAS